jgi:hypothetical protein
MPSGRGKALEISRSAPNIQDLRPTLCKRSGRRTPGSMVFQKRFCRQPFLSAARGAPGRRGSKTMRHADHAPRKPRYVQGPLCPARPGRGGGQTDVQESADRSARLVKFRPVEAPARIEERPGRKVGMRSMIRTPKQRAHLNQVAK